MDRNTMTLLHSPAHIMVRWLIDSGIAVESCGSVRKGVWAATVNFGDSPDHLIGVTNTPGLMQGRTMEDGVFEEKEGLQFRIRGRGPEDAWTKTVELYEALEALYRALVTLDNTNYLIHSVTRGPIAPLGTEPNQRRRYSYSINGGITVGQTT